MDEEFEPRGRRKDWLSREAVELALYGPSPCTRWVWGATICPDCAWLRGVLDVLDAAGHSTDRYEQRCRCEPVGERWPGWDFNALLELCRCCAVVPLRSGSRWSRFFCDECLERVAAFNRACGCWVIPIGRHSAMHGDVLGGDEAAIEEHAEHFVAQVRGLFAATDHLDQWASTSVKRNLGVLGFATGAEVDLGRYVRAARLRGLDKQGAFENLVEHFADTVRP